MKFIVHLTTTPSGLAVKCTVHFFTVTASLTYGPCFLADATTALHLLPWTKNCVLLADGNINVLSVVDEHGLLILQVLHGLPGHAQRGLTSNTCQAIGLILSLSFSSANANGAGDSQHELCHNQGLIFYRDWSMDTVSEIQQKRTKHSTGAA